MKNNEKEFEFTPEEVASNASIRGPKIIINPINHKRSIAKAKRAANSESARLQYRIYALKSKIKLYNSKIKSISKELDEAYGFLASSTRNGFNKRLQHFKDFLAKRQKQLQDTISKKQIIDAQNLAKENNEKKSI